MNISSNAIGIDKMAIYSVLQSHSQ